MRTTKNAWPIGRIVKGIVRENLPPLQIKSHDSKSRKPGDLLILWCGFPRCLDKMQSRSPHHNSLNPNRPTLWTLCPEPYTLVAMFRRYLVPFKASRLPHV